MHPVRVSLLPTTGLRRCTNKVSTMKLAARSWPCRPVDEAFESPPVNSDAHTSLIDYDCSKDTHGEELNDLGDRGLRR